MSETQTCLLKYKRDYDTLLKFSYIKLAILGYNYCISNKYNILQYYKELMTYLLTIYNIKTDKGVCHTRIFL